MFEELTLYKNYSAKGTGTKNIIARMEQREKWLLKHKENGSCEKLLVEANIIDGDDDE